CRPNRGGNGRCSWRRRRTKERTLSGSAPESPRTSTRPGIWRGRRVSNPGA
ncbi:MAG: hypothetical protein AVDCRST_MAG19-4371, partial [uncultured Thermomicrobiales bacterium]